MNKKTLTHLVLSIGLATLVSACNQEVSIPSASSETQGEPQALQEPIDPPSGATEESSIESNQLRSSATLPSEEQEALTADCKEAAEKYGVEISGAVVSSAPITEKDGPQVAKACAEEGKAATASSKNSNSAEPEGVEVVDFACCFVRK